jgi:hypothetical protein
VRRHLGGQPASQLPGLPRPPAPRATCPWAAGDIDLVSSDHSPAPPELKLLESGDFIAAWGGINGARSWAASLSALALHACWQGRPARLRTPPGQLPARAPPPLHAARLQACSTCCPPPGRRCSRPARRSCASCRSCCPTRPLRWPTSRTARAPSGQASGPCPACCLRQGPGRPAPACAPAADLLRAERRGRWRRVRGGLGRP